MALSLGAGLGHSASPQSGKAGRFDMVILKSAVWRITIALTAEMVQAVLVVVRAGECAYQHPVRLAPPAGLAGPGVGGPARPGRGGAGRHRCELRPPLRRGADHS